MIPDKSHIGRARKASQVIIEVASEAIAENTPHRWSSRPPPESTIVTDVQDLLA